MYKAPMTTVLRFSATNAPKMRASTAKNTPRAFGNWKRKE